MHSTHAPESAVWAPWRYTDSRARTYVVRPAIERFFRHVASSDDGDCWLWTGYVDIKGYGRFRGEPHNRAHRWIYEAMIAEIPEGLTLDHLCRVRNCVNPYHLEPVTLIENSRRGEGSTAAALQAGACKWGHPTTDAYAYYEQTPTGRMKRHCRECRNRRNREWWRRVA